MNDLPKGTYNADVYLASAIIPFSPVPDTSEKTLAVWKRLSQSTVLPHYSRNNGVIVNRHSVHRLDSATQLLEGYVYKIDLGNGAHQWIPDYVNETGKVSLSYSVLSYRSSGGLNPYACDTINTGISIPNSDEAENLEIATNEIIVFPNPNTGQTQIKWSFDEEVSLYIYNSNGQLILNKMNLPREGQFDLHLQKPGVYLVRATDKNSSKTTKFIVL